MITCQIFFQQVIIFLIFSILYFLDATRQLSIRSIFLHFTPNIEKVLPQRQRHAFVKLAYNCPATVGEQIINFPAWLQRRHGLRPQWSKFSICVTRGSLIS